jgi:NHL repeat-containing protein
MSMRASGSKRLMAMGVAVMLQTVFLTGVRCNAAPPVPIVVVPDSGWDRVLIYEAPFSDSMPASLVLGQQNFTSTACAVTQDGLCSPAGVALDRKSNLWVADASNNRVVFFNKPLSTGMNATVVIGQPNFTSSDCGAPTLSTLCDPEAVSVDGAGNLWISDAAHNRVLEYEPPFATGMAASLVLGQPDFSSAGCSTTAEGVCSPAGTAFDGKGRLFVADSGSNRVLVYNPPFTNGMAASRVMGQPDFVSSSCNTTQNGLCQPEAVARRRKRLFVADTGNRRVLGYLAPFVTGMKASLVLGQPNFTSPPTDGCETTQASACAPIGLGLNRQGQLFVADENDDRTVLYAPPFVNGMNASLVIGQPDFNSDRCSATDVGNCDPERIAVGVLR